MQGGCTYDVYRVTMKVETGRLCETGFSDRRCFLVYTVNSVACVPFGIVRDLHQLYPYENTYTGRRKLYSLSRACVDSRDNPGTVIVHNPPEKTNSPHLIACVTQYGWGDSIESNAKANEALMKSRDRHYVEGLTADTRLNRRLHFQTCMKKLAILAMGHPECEQVVLAQGMGRGGRDDEEWNEHYLPAIEGLADRLQNFGIETILLKP